VLGLPVAPWLEVFQIHKEASVSFRRPRRFVHISEKAGLAMLNEGQRVSFDIVSNSKRGKNKRPEPPRLSVSSCLDRSSCTPTRRSNDQHLATEAQALNFRPLLQCSADRFAGLVWPPAESPDIRPGFSSEVRATALHGRCSRHSKCRAAQPEARDNGSAVDLLDCKIRLWWRRVLGSNQI